jgi:hypothetical protein
VVAYEEWWQTPSGTDESFVTLVILLGLALLNPTNKSEANL